MSSVKITKRREKRDTSLLRFIIVALLPLFLIAWFGFTLGRSVDKGDNIKDETITEAQTRATRANQKVDALNLLNRRLDTLVDELVKKTNLLNESIVTAYASNEPTQIGVWVGERDELFRVINTKALRIQNDFTQLDNKLSEEEVEISFNLFRKTVDMAQLLLIARKAEKDRQYRDQVETIESEELGDIEAQKKELEHQQEIFKLENKISRLEIKLEKASSDGAATEEVDNEPHVEKIEDQIGVIRKLVPDIKASFIGNSRKKLKEISDDINTSLDGMEEAVKEIN